MKMGSQNRQRKKLFLLICISLLFVCMFVCAHVCTSCNCSFSRTWRLSSLNALMDENRQSTFGDPSCFKMDALKISSLPLLSFSFSSSAQRWPFLSSSHKKFLSSHLSFLSLKNDPFPFSRKNSLPLLSFFSPSFPLRITFPLLSHKKGSFHILSSPLPFLPLKSYPFPPLLQQKFLSLPSPPLP